MAIVGRDPVGGVTPALLIADERVNVAAGALVEYGREQHNRAEEVAMPPTISLATAHDASGVQAIYTLIVRDTAISFELEPPSAEDMGRQVKATLQHMPWLACEQRGEVLGYVYASQHRARPA
jgi:hypothetical protein